MDIVDDVKWIDYMIYNTNRTNVLMWVEPTLIDLMGGVDFI